MQGCSECNYILIIILGGVYTQRMEGKFKVLKL